MQKTSIYRIALLCAITVKSLGASFATLEKFSANVTQYRSRTYFNGRSCGFFVLDNAQKIEQDITGKRPVPFGSIDRMAQANNIKRKAGTASSFRVQCNDSLIHLPEFCSLGIMPDGSVSLVAEDTKYRCIFTSSVATPSLVSTYNKHTLELMHECVAPWYMRTNMKRIKSFADSQWQENSRSYFDHIRHKIKQVDRTKKPLVVHFDCTLAPQESHCVLASVVKKPGKKPYRVRSPILLLWIISIFP